MINPFGDSTDKLVDKYIFVNECLPGCSRTTRNISDQFKAKSGASLDRDVFTDDSCSSSGHTRKRRSYKKTLRDDGTRNYDSMEETDKTSTNIIY